VDQDMEGARPLLDIELSHDEDGVVIVLSGELDVSTAPLLRDRLNLLIRSGAIKLTCYIPGLRFIDSSGLSVLLMAHKRLNKLGGTLTLLSPVPSVRRLLEITGVDDYLDIQPPGEDKTEE
jgi:anti-sigma B factor antagonist